MRYFVLNQDKRHTDIPRPKNFHEKIDVRKLTAEHSEQIPLWTLIKVHSSVFTVFPDILCTPTVMVSKDVKSVIKMYDDSIVYRQIVYLDQENEQTQLYFVPLLDTVNCLSPTNDHEISDNHRFSRQKMIPNQV